MWSNNNEILPMKIVAPVLLALWLLAPAFASALDEADKWSLFKDAESSFRQANEVLANDPGRAGDLFEKAVLSYERIVWEGKVENGKIFYNIGNIYFRLGDIGRAILSYRRAEELIPGDANLRQNLAYARSRCLDRIDAKPEAQVLQAIFFWHYDLSLFNRARLFLLFFALVWIVAGIHLLRRRTWTGYLLLFSILVSLLLGGSMGVEAYEKGRHHAGVILEKEIIARKGDSTTYEPSFKDPLHSGTEFKLLEQRANWLHIELVDGRQCWIPDSAAGML